MRLMRQLSLLFPRVYHGTLPAYQRGFAVWNPFGKSESEPQATEPNENPNIHTQTPEQIKADAEKMMKQALRDPRLSSLLEKPNVQAALTAMQANPRDAFKHFSDPDVAEVMSKMIHRNPGLGQQPSQGTAQSSQDKGHMMQSMLESSLEMKSFASACMSDPQLVALMNKPNVQAALKNAGTPAGLMKHMGDPDIRAVMQILMRLQSKA